MGVTKDFKIRLQVDSNGEKVYADLNDQTLEYLYSNTQLEKELAMVQAAFLSVQSELAAVSDAYAQSARSANRLTGAVNEQNTALNRDAKAMEALGMSANSLFSDFERAISSIANFAQTIDIMTSPEKLSRLSALINILAAVARFKGMEDLSNNLRKIGEQVTVVSGKIEAFRRETIPSFEEASKKASLFLSVMDGLGVAIKSAIGVLGVGGIAGAAIILTKNFKSMADVTDALSKGLVFVKENQSKIRAQWESDAPFLEKAMSSFKIGFDGGREAAVKFGASTKESLREIKPGFVGLFDAAALLGPQMVALGHVLGEVDNEFVKVIGRSITAAGVFGAVFAAAIVFAVKALGNFAEAMGDMLIKTMDEFTKKANEVQAVMKNLGFVIAGFSREIGKSAVGSQEIWDNEMRKIVESTNFTQKEVAKSISLLVKEGTSLGLTVDQNAEVLQRAADIAASSGQELEQVTQAILKALTGNSDALFNLGIDVRDVALAHSKYVEEAGKTVDELTMLEKQQARLDLLFKKSAGVVGAAAAATTTATGAYKQLEKQIDAVKISLGEQGFVTQFLIRTQSQLLRTLISLPKPIFDFVGAFIDVLGVFLKVAGVVTTNVFLILTLTSAYKILTVVVVKYTVVQATLNQVFDVFALAAGTKAVQIKTLADVFKNLSILTKALSANMGSVLIKALGTVTSAFSKLVRFITPFALKFALIAGVIYGIVQAFRELVQENETFARIANVIVGAFEYVKEVLQDLIGDVFDFSDSWNSSITIMEAVAKFFTNFAKIVLVGLAQAALLTGIALLKVKKFFADDSEEKEYEERIDSLRNEIVSLTNVSENAAAEILRLADSTAYAEERQKRAAQTAAEHAAAIEKEREEVEKLVKLNMKGFSLAEERIKSMGTEFDKAVLAQKEANRELAKAEDLVAHAAEKAKEIAEARKEVAKAGIGIEKLRFDTIKGFSDQEADLVKNALRDSGDLQGAVRAEFTERKRLFDEAVKGLTLLGKLNEKQIAQIDRTRAALAKAEAAALSNAQAEELKKAQEGLDSLKDKIKDLQKQTIELNYENMKFGASERDLVRLEYEKQSAIVDTLEMELRNSGILTAENEQIIDQYREALEAKRNLANQKLGIGSISIGDIRESLASAFTDLGSFGADFAESFSGGFDNVADDLQELAGNVWDFAADGLESLWDSAVKSFDSITLGDITNAIIDGFKAGAEYLQIGFSEFQKVLNGDYINAITDFVTQLGSAPDVILEAAKKLMQAIQDMIAKLPQAIKRMIQDMPKLVESISKTIGDLADTLVDSADSMMDSIEQNLPKLMDSLINAFSKLLDKALAAAPRVGQMMAQMITKLVRLIIDAIPKILDAMPNFMDMIFNAIPGIIDMIMAALPKIITSLINMIVKSITGLVRIIPSIVSSIFEFLDDIIFALVDGLLGGIGEIITFLIEDFIFGGGLEKIIGSILRAIPRIIVALVRGIWNGLVKIFTSLGHMLERMISGAKPKVPEPPAWIEALPTDIAEGAKDLGKTIARETSQLFQVKDLEEAIPGIKAVNKVQGTSTTSKETEKSADNAGKKAGKSMWQTFADWAAKEWHVFLNWGSKVWEGLNKGLKKFEDMSIKIGAQIWKGLTDAHKKAGKTLNEMGRGIFKGLLESHKTAGQWLLNPKKFWKDIEGFQIKMANYLATWMQNLLNGIVQAVVLVFGTIADWIGKIVDAFAGRRARLEEMFKSMGGKIAEGFKAVGGEISEFFKDLGGSFNEGLQEVKDEISGMFSALGGDVFSGFSASIDLPVMTGMGTAMGTGFITNITAFINEAGGKIAAAFKANFAWPEIPKFTWPAMPSFSWPSMPSFSWPALPKWTWPSISEPQWVKDLKNLGGGGGGGGGGSGIPNPLGLKLGGLVSAAYMAFGGMVQPIYAQDGLLVPYMPKGRDTVPLMTEPGEFVVNRAATQQNMGLLNHVNKGGDASDFGGGTTIHIAKIEVIANTDMDVEEIWPKIEKKIKKSTQNGRYLIDSKGVR